MLSYATLGGGCYWCLEAYYQQVRGIESVVSGYSGGAVDHPTTEQVYSGTTGHTEVVQLAYDPNLISYRDILEIFFVMHDPTTLNQQGNDVGDWYRSAIFYHSDKQRHIAYSMKKDFAASLYTDPIVTEITPLHTFWPADQAMQDFYNTHPTAGYCLAVINPKLEKLRKELARFLV